MRSRYHSCKSSGWKLKYFRHGAESTLLAPIGITRYPFSGKACFCIAPKDTPRRFSLCRMITNLKIKRSRTRKESSVYRLLASRRTNPNHWRYAFGARRDSNPRNPSWTGSKEQGFFWHTLWNILVHRCEGSTQTLAWSNLASIFYQSIYRFSRKKSCELLFESAA